MSPEAAAEAAGRARAAGKRVKLVTSYFDPLLAAHARRLQELADRDSVLVAVIREPEHPVLAARARAELVAALAAVDFVILGGELDTILSGVEPDELFRDDEMDERRRQDLIRHVQSRHK